MGLYMGGLYTEPFLCVEIFTPVIWISRKKWKTKNYALAAKRYFATLQETKRVMFFTIWNH